MSKHAFVIFLYFHDLSLSIYVYKYILEPTCPNKFFYNYIDHLQSIFTSPSRSFINIQNISGFQKLTFQASSKLLSSRQLKCVSQFKLNSIDNSFINILICYM